MKIQKIKDKEINHIRYCKIQFIDQAISCSLWIPSKEHSRTKKTISLDYANDELVIYDPTDLIPEDITGDGIYTYLLNLLNSLINDDMYFLQSIEDKLTKMEDALIVKNDNESFESNIFQTRRTIRTFHSYYNQLTEIIESISEHSDQFDSLDKRINRLSNYTDHLSEYSSELRDMHHTKIETKQNQIMQLLTIVTTIFMPLTLITGWYGMNFKIMPELETDNGYFVVIGICVAIILFEFYYFKKKKWF